MKNWNISYLRDWDFQVPRVYLGKLSDALTQMEYLIPVILISLVLIMAARIPIDSDQWWHLRAGEVTWMQKSPLTTDHFSFTREGSNWINHSWLSELIMFLLFRWSGYRGLTIMVAGLAAATIGLIYLQMEGSPLTRAFLLVAGIPVMALVWSPRPQMFSMLCFAVLSYLLHLYKWRKRNFLWMSPLLFMIWSNMHGGYPLGLMLMGAWIVGEILNHIFGQSDDKSLAADEIAQILIWLSLSALVVIINPNGISMWSIPFKTVSIQVLQDFIVEWKSPDFHELQQQPFLWLLFATFGVAGLSRRRIDGTELVSLVLFAYLGFLARRNLAPFGIIAIPVLSRHLPHLRFYVQNRVRFLFHDPRINRRFSKRSSLVINVLLIWLLMTGVVMKVNVVSSPNMVGQYEQQKFPSEAVQWIRANKPQGNIFNSYNWGGYLIWHLPEYPVFIDGRTDLYGENLLEVYLSIMRGDDGWDQKLNSFGINLILIESGSPLGRELKRNNLWWLGYEDDLAEIYVRVDRKVNS